MRWIGWVLLGACLAGCPRPLPVDEPVGGGSSLQADADEDFAAAVALYEGARFGEAVDAFRLFVALHSADARAVRAELYLGRALAADGDTLAAARVFEGLHSAPDTAATAELALLYRAFVASLRAETEWGRDLLVDALDASPTLRVVDPIPGDAAALHVLLAEAHFERGALAEAIAALSAVVEAGEASLHEDYAIERAFDACGELSARDADLLSVTSLLAEAATAATRVRSRLDGGDAEGAAAVLDATEDALLRVDALELLARLRAEVAEPGTATAPTYGLVTSLTGPYRRAGRAALGAVLLAQRAFEDRDARSVVRIEDDAGTEAGARDAIARLAAEGVSVVLGPVAPELTEAAAREAERAGVALIALTSTPLEGPREGVMRWLISAEREAEAVVTEAWARGVSRIAVVRPAAEGGRFLDAFADAVTRRFDEAGGALALDVAVDALDDATLQASASAAARAIADSDADAVVLALDAEAGATLAAYLASENIWPSRSGAAQSASGRRQVTYIGNSFLVSETLIRNSSRYVQGAILPSWYTPEEAVGATQRFADRFAWTYGREAGVLEAFAFDAAQIARRLVVDEGVRSGDVAAARLAVGVPIDAVIGEPRFDARGEPLITPALLTVEGETFRRIFER